MKIKFFGSKFWGSQVQRIEKAFDILGYDVNKHDINDVIYSNDTEHALEAIKHKEKFGGKLILNVLDVPHWIGNFEEHKQKTVPLLKYADRLTCISQTVQKDIKEYYGLNSHVIYNPIKDVSNLNFKRFQSVLYVGRANDVNKRFNLVVDFSKTYLHSLPLICGSENPGFGKYLGVVSDEELNYLYNISKYLIQPSKEEGLSLTPLEFLVAGGTPILTNDNRVFREIWPSFMLCNPTPESMMNKIMEYESGAYKEELKELGLKFSHKFNKMSIAQNILDIL
jgi:glycosyltransferase involved in cell wall biosynthesis